MDFGKPAGEFVGWCGFGEMGDDEAFFPAGLFVADGFGQDGTKGRVERAAVVVRDPLGELEDFGGDFCVFADDFVDALEGRVIGLGQERSDRAEDEPRAERNLDPGADQDLAFEDGRNEIIEFFPQD